MIGDFLRLCSAPERAYSAKYADAVYYGMTFPCAAFLLFALNVAIERASFLQSAGGIRIVLLAFIGLLLGAASAGIFTLFGFLCGKSAKKEMNALRFLGVCEYSFAPAVVIELLGLLAQIVFGASTASVFGILGIFVAMLPIFRGYDEICGIKGLKYIVFCAIAGFAVMLCMNIVFFITF